MKLKTERRFSVEIFLVIFTNLRDKDFVKIVVRIFLSQTFVTEWLRNI